MGPKWSTMVQNSPNKIVLNSQMVQNCLELLKWSKIFQHCQIGSKLSKMIQYDQYNPNMT